MKTIYLKAEVEDDTPTDQAVICLNDYDWSEVYLPTEEEVNLFEELIDFAVWIEREVYGYKPGKDVMTVVVNEYLKFKINKIKSQ